MALVEEISEAKCGFGVRDVSKETPKTSSSLVGSTVEEPSV